MMESKRRRVASCAEEDRISNLPEHLIESILEGLPIEEAVRTSIISKKWRYRWTTMRALVFNQNFSSKFANNGAFSRNGVIRIINQVLFLHNGPILKFHLHIPNMFLDSFQEIDQWVLFLSRNGVTDLVLTNSSYSRYELPSYLFSCLELTKLDLVKCFYKPPLEFQGFHNLEDLRLVNIDFKTSLCGDKINLPWLKRLRMGKCTNAHNFNIEATKLEFLNVVACPDVMLLQLLDSPCLIQVGIVFQNLPQDFAPREKMTLATMLSNLPKVQHFFIDNHFFKVLVAEKIPKLLPCVMNSLKHLLLIHFQLDDLELLQGALCLLRNSPELEILRMYMMNTHVNLRADVGPAADHLESPNCLDCKLNKLQIVEIKCLQGSRPELLFIELLLAHSPSLQNFTITPSRDSDVKKRLDITIDVMQFSRASPKAKLFFINS